MTWLRMAMLHLRALRGRLLVLLAFSAVFVAAAVTARLLSGGADGHVELDRIFEVGGAPLASALLLLGWAIGRFPMIAVLVLMAGVVSRDRVTGHARLYFTRPGSPLGLYAVRFFVLALTAFAMSAVLVPLFDVIMLGHWAGPNTLLLIAAYIVTYGSITALLSAWTRGDAWIALLFGSLAIVWHSLRAGGVLENTPPGVREVVTLVLPPHGALFSIESAFARASPPPLDALLYISVYGAVLLVLAGISVAQREV